MKNPFMSLFLSGANRIAGAARAQATAAIKREATRNARQVTQATQAWTQAWADAWLPSPTRKKKSRRQ